MKNIFFCVFKMGNTIATGSINQAIQESLNIFNKAYQNCNGNVNQRIDITLDACGDVKLKNWDLTQNSALNVGCVQNANLTSEQKMSITDQFVQTAKAISQNVDFNPGTTEANNLVAICMNLSETISNVISQQCDLSNNQVINFNVNAGNTTTGCIPPNQHGTNRQYGGNIDIVGFLTNQSSNAQLNCATNQKGVATQVSQIKTMISQKATATVENALWPIVILIIGIAFAVAYLFSRPGVIKWIIIGIIGILVLILIYFIVAYFIKLWPFKNRGGHKEKKRVSPYSFPAEWFPASPDQTKAMKVVLAIAYGYARQCPSSGSAYNAWPQLQELLFPDAPVPPQGPGAVQVFQQNAIKVFNENGSSLVSSSEFNALSKAINQPCQKCGCACKTCLKLNPTSPSSCALPCNFMYCPGQEDKQGQVQC